MEPNNFMPNTSTRVQQHTRGSVNDQIRSNTIAELDAVGGDTQKIKTRLEKIDQEWNIERALEANASSLILLGLGLGHMHSKKWLGLSAIVSGFLFQHAVQGWCPPLPILRRLGFRAQREIDDERAILLERLGTFENMSTASSAEAMNRLHS